MGSDAIFYISTHGDPGRVYCYSSTSISASSVASDNNNYSLQAYFAGTTSKLRNMRLAYYSGCRTGLSDSTYGNLPSYSVSTLGVDCAVGFTDYIGIDESAYFDRAAFTSMKSGQSIGYSLYLAADQTYAAFGGYYGGVDSYVTYGGSGISIYPAAYGSY